MAPPPPENDDLFAAIDMGTNSFKIVIIQFNPSSGHFIAVDRIADRVVLGRDSSTLISSSAFLRAVQCLREFAEILRSRGISLRRTRCVATSAVREAANGGELVDAVRAATGIETTVVSGEEEAKFVYCGVSQFLSVRERRVLLVDIGGGSTEFVIGERGVVEFGASLKLGHVSLTQRFGADVEGIKGFVRGVIEGSGLVEDVKRFGFEVAVGSSGTIGAVEKAVLHGYGDGKHTKQAETSTSADELLRRQVKRDWRFSRRELKSVVERLSWANGDEEMKKREDLFKKRSEFIVAGAVLLEVIFEMLGIEEMEVSEYGLGEGVVAEALKKESEGFVLSDNPRWNSVVRCVSRFSDKKRIKVGARCATISKGIFDGLRQCGKLGDSGNLFKVPFTDGDLECLQAACLLHSVGLFGGKKGYHKLSYHVIMDGDHLHGFSTEEIKLIALLARHHRRKFPKHDDDSFINTTEDVPSNFHTAGSLSFRAGVDCSLIHYCLDFQFRMRVQALSAIIRISFILQKNESLSFQDIELLPSGAGFRLILKDATNKPILLSGEIMKDLRRELEHFHMVFQQQLRVEVPTISNASDQLRS
ncbi:ppx [Linum grandiflorum]